MPRGLPTRLPTATRAGCAPPARACASGEPRKPRASRAPSWSPGHRGCAHRPASSSRPRSSSRRRRSEAVAHYRSVWEQPYARPSLRAEAAERARQARTGGAPRGARPSSASIQNSYIKSGRFRAISHIFVTPPRTRATPVASGCSSHQTGSWSRFQRFPHQRAQPKLLHPHGMGTTDGKKSLTRFGGVPTLRLVCEAP